MKRNGVEDRWPEAVRLLLHGVGRFRRAGAPECEFLHIDRFPCLIPMIVAFVGSFPLVIGEEWQFAGGLIFGGIVVSWFLFTFAAPPTYQAVVAHHLVLRQMWRHPLVFRRTDIDSIARTDLFQRTGKYVRTVFRVMPAGAAIPLTFTIGSLAVADQLAEGLERAGIGRKKSMPGSCPEQDDKRADEANSAGKKHNCTKNCRVCRGRNV